MDSTKQIKGTNMAPSGRGPRQRDHNVTMPGSHTETIRESQYRDGQVRHGINPANVRRDASARHYTHPEAEAHRQRERSQPIKR